MLSRDERARHSISGAAAVLCALLLPVSLPATQIIPSTIETIDALFSRAPMAIEGEVLGHQDIYD
ncbi:MAG: hypothetical protein FJY66_02110, partial [Calditrichaeota bacterium]|nr:hypothetical protein [Calditrichota bacterium]